MSRTVHYTHRFAPNSEVIKAVFYDGKQEELFVVLHSGVIAGYHSVRLSTYYDFASAESAGKFWNWEVKGMFGTLNGDVNFAPAESENVSNAGKQSFSVVVNLNGDLKFDIDSTDVAEAVRKVTELVEKTLVTGGFFVKEVKFNQ